MFTYQNLCFLVNKYGSTSVKNIKDVILSFYDMEESDVPCLMRQQDNNRSDSDVDDIVEYITRFDEERLMVALPKFVAADQRISTYQYCCEKSMPGLYFRIYSSPISVVYWYQFRFVSS